MQKKDEKYFLPYQIKWLQDRSQIKIWEKSRRIGATYVQSYEDVEDCVTGRVPAVWFSSADETAAREYILYCEQWAKMFNMAASKMQIGEVMDGDKAIKTMWINFANGIRITALTSNPRKFRSKGGKAVWDEAAWHDDQLGMWAALKPVATWGYPIRIMSTHHGTQSLFYQFLQRIKQGEVKWAAHYTDIFQAVKDGLVDKIYGRKTTAKERKEWLEEERKNCITPDIWLEEYCCQPVDESTAFLPYELIGTCEKQPREIIRDLSECSGDLYVGMDIGRKKDLSVIWVVERLGYQSITRKVAVLERAPFNVQWETLKAILQLKNMRRTAIDATGLGMQLAEQAQQFAGTFRVEPVTFTAKVKEEIAYNLHNRMEDRAVLIPADDAVRADLHSTRKVVTAAGNIRFDVAATEKTDGHADRFWALGLALHAANNPAAPLDVRTKKSTKKKRLNDFISGRAKELMHGFRS